MISTLDRPLLLERCLAALAAGATRPAEIVVVNQGDAAPVESIVRRAEATGLRIAHVQDDRRGLSRSQNLGVRTARGPIVAVIDDDCVPDERWVEVVGSSFRDPSVDLLTGRILSLPAVGDRQVAVANRTSEVRQEHRWPVVPWVVGSGGSFAVRRDRYLAVGGNDERLGTGTPGRAGNDMDLFYRLLKSGSVARYEPDLIVQHERATVAERRSRRGSYGFGVGACAGRWWRDGDWWALHALLAWLRLRAGELGRRRSLAAFGDETRMLAGTVAGLWYGLRLGASWQQVDR